MFLTENPKIHQASSRQRRNFLLVTRYTLIECSFKVQKQPPEVFFKKMCSQKSCKNHRKKPVICNVIEIALWHGYLPVNLLHIFRTSFLKNTSEGLLLSGLGVFLWILRNFKNTVFIQHLRKTAFKGKFFLFLSLSFSSFENIS